MKKTFRSPSAFMLHFALLAGLSSDGWATGGFEPETLFDKTPVEKLSASHEFFWELEVKRIALEFKPVEKRTLPPPDADPKAPKIVAPSDTTIIDLSRQRWTASTDLSECAAALKSGYLTVSDPDAALASFRQSCEVLDKSNVAAKDDRLPEEPESEFAFYHQGTLFYKWGHWEDAATAWRATPAIRGSVFEVSWRGAWYVRPNTNRRSHRWKLPL